MPDYYRPIQHSCLGDKLLWQSGVGSYNKLFVTYVVLICFSSMDILCDNPIHPSVDAGVADHRDGV